MLTIKDIYDYIDEIAPFSLQESYDNSGLIIGNGKYGVTKALIALDVTADIAWEAVKTGAELIITHHPIIFKAVKRIDTETPLGILLANDTSVISAHTNFDSAVMNDILCEKLGLTPKEPLAVENGVPIGYICETDKEYTAKEIAQLIKTALGNKVVRYNDFADNDVRSEEREKITRIAVCSGSGGSFLPEVISKNCGAFITGDVKHDVFIDGHNAGIRIFDAGHFHTENIFCEYMRKTLSEKFPETEFTVAKNNRDILNYEF